MSQPTFVVYNKNYQFSHYLETVPTTEPTEQNMQDIYSTMFSLFFTPELENKYLVKPITKPIDEAYTITAEEYVYNQEKDDYLLKSPQPSQEDKQYIVYDSVFGYFTLYNIRKIQNTITFSMLHNDIGLDSPKRKIKNMYKMTLNNDQITNNTYPKLKDELIALHNPATIDYTEQNLTKRWNMIEDKMKNILRTFSG